MSSDEKYGKEFVQAYVSLMGDVWRSEAEETRLLADPTAYAIEKGLPVDPGATVRLDRTQPDGLLKSSEVVRDWTASPGTHVLHVPAEEIISEGDLSDTDLELITAGNTYVIACVVFA
jgi:hypothetical protein